MSALIERPYGALGPCADENAPSSVVLGGWLWTFAQLSRGQRGVSPGIRNRYRERLPVMSETIGHAERRPRRRRPGAGRPSKGKRFPTWALLPSQVSAWVHQVSEAHNKVGDSQVIADLVSMAAGKSDFVLALNHQTLDSLMPPDDPQLQLHALPDDGTTEEILTRLPPPVWAWVSAMADTYKTSLKQIVGDVVSTAAGRADLVRKMNRKEEGLPLAI